MQMTNQISDTQPSNNPFASASLYVGDLASDVTEATLFELFNAIGPVSSIRVCRDTTTRISLGYAYVIFHSVQDAERALDTMNFTKIRGKECRIMWSQRDPRLRQYGKANIFVKNLHESIDNKTLYDTFSVFGNILSCKVVIDKKTQKSRGYGYVHYIDVKSAKKAIEGATGMTISGRTVEVELFKPREERIKNEKYTNVYVKYIPKNWNEKILKKIFEEATGGKINKFQIWRHDYGVSACLNFSNSEAAKTAVEKLNDVDVSSFDIVNDLLIKNEQEEKETEKPTKLYVARAQKRKERKEFYVARVQKRTRGGSGRNYSGANLYVKNLSPAVNDTKLYEMFIDFGTITSAKIMREASGKSRGFGFVAFAKKEAATRAIHEMTNTLHHGKPLYVSRAQTKAFRQTLKMKQLCNKRMRNNMGGPVGEPGGGYGIPMQQFPYGMVNPLVIQQQQQLAARQLAAQQLAAQQMQIPYLFSRTNLQNNHFTNLLKEWNLSQYIEILRNEGYEDIIDCTDLSLQALTNMGFKLGHAKKLNRKINEYMNKNKNKNNVNNNNNIEHENDDNNEQKEGYVNTDCM